MRQTRIRNIDAQGRSNDVMEEFDSMSFDSSSKMTASTASFEYAKAVRMKGKIVMQTVSVDSNQVSYADDAPEIDTYDPTMSLIEGLVGQKDTDYATRQSAHIPEMDLKTGRFSPLQFEKDYLESIARKNKRLLQWSLLACLLATSLNAFIRMGTRAVIASLIAPIVSLVLILMHLVQSYTYRSYKWTTCALFFVPVLLTSYFLITSNPFLYIIHLVQFPILAITLRLDYFTTKALFWICGCIYCASLIYTDSQIDALRQLPALVVFLISSLHLSSSVDKADRRKYLDLLKISYSDLYITEQKGKRMKVLETLYPRLIAQDLKNETIFTLKTYASESCMTMAIRILWKTEKCDKIFLGAKTVHRNVDQILSRAGVEKIKSCGDMIMATTGAFQLLSRRDVDRAFEAARNLCALNIEGHCDVVFCS
eukprot:TRINITY_DN3459_c0_g1_i9.p1 TRINITY_DN3459_c0_g1~~TRINITY_DN3459_c0_g1_i9.p1  ORF type:complete len:425 (+),score=65.48 TRINITY_DN3459_c0_g1_i9:83-1357(+)